MRISGTEPSSVILNQTCSLKSLKVMTKKCHIMHFEHFYTKMSLKGKHSSFCIDLYIILNNGIRSLSIYVNRFKIVYHSSLEIFICLSVNAGGL